MTVTRSRKRRTNFTNLAKQIAVTKCILAIREWCKGQGMPAELQASLIKHVETKLAAAK